MPVDSATVRYQFPTTLGRFSARFDAGRATSEGGLVWLAEAERMVAVCAADRLSCHRFWANQFRLFLHAAAYWLLDTLRGWLRQAGQPPLQLDSLRTSFLKIGAVLVHVSDIFLLRLASSHPAQHLWDLLTRPSRLGDQRPILRE